MFPGATKKLDCRTKGDILTEVTEEIVWEAQQPITLLEMQASTGRDAGALKKLVTPNLGRPKKSKESSGDREN
jgi:hypothetical protein